MFYKEVLLKDIEPKLSSSNAKLRIYISDRNEAVTLKPGLIVCPGGGYSYCSPREAEPIAFRFLSEGFNCFILDYTCNQKYPTPHLEVAAVMNYLRNHEEEFDLIPNSLSLIGFSAGGHLVASYGYLYPELAKELDYEPSRIRPRAVLLGYPVTVLNEFTHQGTMDIICGGDDSLKEKLTVITHVNKDYPPTFAWATKDDEMVPVVNTTSLEEALEKNGVKHQCLVFESGYHGASLDNRFVYARNVITEKMKDIRDWASLAADFIFDVIDYEN